MTQRSCVIYRQMSDTDTPSFAAELDWALRLHKAGVLDEAAASYREILQSDPAHAEASFLLGSIELQQGSGGAASLDFAVAAAGMAEPGDAQAALSGALEGLTGAERAGALEAIAAHGPIRNAGGRAAGVIRILRLHRAAAPALALAEAVLEAAPEAADIHRLRASLLMDLGRLNEAADAFRNAVAIVPDDIEILTAYSAVLAQLGRPEEALDVAERAAVPGLAASDADRRRIALMQLLSCQIELGRFDAAVERFRAYAEAAPALAEVWIALARSLHAAGRHDEAEQAAASGLRRTPGHLELEWLHCVYALVPIYRSSEEIAERRRHYADRLRALSDRLAAADRYARDRARLLAADLTPYLLPYQGGDDDRALQEVYGAMLHELSDVEDNGQRDSAETPPPDDDGRHRVVFISAFIWRHTNWRMKRGWVKYLDRTKFRVACIHLGERRDEMTEEVQGYADEFHHLPSDFDGAVALLRRMRPDVVFYPEIGMSGLAQRLAALRLAPVQCCAIGHPVTTGLPTIDYFVSGDLIEPEGAAEHYSETLITLPGISFPYIPAPLPVLPLDRAHFGLPDEAVLYLCLQTPQKYLPADDDLYPRIAREVPDALFVFLRGGSRIFDMSILEGRLAAAFCRHGLDPVRHLRFLPHLRPEEYQALNTIGDVSLDTPGWSGGNTTLESLYQDLPVVTLPGRLMRSRVSAGMLELIGVRETIAADAADFIRIAVRLAKDPDWRGAISDAIRQQKPRLEHDMRSIMAMETFLETAIARTRSDNP